MAGDGGEDFASRMKRQMDERVEERKRRGSRTGQGSGPGGRCPGPQGDSVGTRPGPVDALPASSIASLTASCFTTAGAAFLGQSSTTLTDAVPSGKISQSLVATVSRKAG